MAGFSSLKADTHITPHKGYAEYSEVRIDPLSLYFSLSLHPSIFSRFVVEFITLTEIRFCFPLRCQRR